MATLKISGVWKDDQGTITHYGVHTVSNNGTTRMTKTTKADAVRLVNDPNNETYTWLWDYTTAFWKNGAKVEVVDSSYLRSNHDGKVSDNLAHLINYNWVIA